MQSSINKQIKTVDELAKKMRAIENKAKRLARKGLTISDDEERNFQEIAKRRWALLTPEIAARCIVMNAEGAKDTTTEEVQSTLDLIISGVGVAAVTSMFRAEVEKGNERTIFMSKIQEVRKQNPDAIWLDDILDRAMEETSPRYANA